MLLVFVKNTLGNIYIKAFHKTQTWALSYEEPTGYAKTAL